MHLTNNYDDTVKNFEDTKSNYLFKISHEKFYKWGKVKIEEIIATIKKVIVDLDSWLTTRNPDIVSTAEKIISSLKIDFSDSSKDSYTSEALCLKNWSLCDSTVIKDFITECGVKKHQIELSNDKQFELLQEVIFVHVLRNYEAQVLKIMEDEYARFILGSVRVYVPPVSPTSQKSSLTKKEIAWIFLCFTAELVNTNKLNRQLLFDFLKKTTGYKSWGKEYKNTTVKSQRTFKEQFNKVSSKDKVKAFVKYFSNEESNIEWLSIDTVDKNSFYKIADYLISVNAFITPKEQVYESFQALFKLENRSVSESEEVHQSLSSFISKYKYLI